MCIFLSAYVRAYVRVCVFVCAFIALFFSSLQVYDSQFVSTGQRVQVTFGRAPCGSMCEDTGPKPLLVATLTHGEFHDESNKPHFDLPSRFLTALDTLQRINKFIQYYMCIKSLILHVFCLVLQH